uniref:Silicon transporter n=1 Tax=Ochromonas triangulata TaxID=1964564 RepID=A0A1D8RAF8_9STRA|nr:silicon transporter [Ochromonas distigma]
MDIDSPAYGKENSLKLDIPLKQPKDYFSKDNILTYIKYILSSALTLTYVIYILWGIFDGQAVLPVHPVVNFIIFCFCMTLVAYLEGLQVAILAVEKYSPDNMQDTHPRAYKLIKSVREGNNVERFLVGRQFFTIFVMTLIAQVTSFPEISNLGINPIVWFIFVQTGLPAALVVTTIGSLQPQLLAARDPWKFLDLYGCNAVLNLCYGMELTGICTHFAWMLVIILRHTLFITEEKPRTHNPEMSPAYYALEGLKFTVSFVVLMTYCSYIMWGIWTGQAILPVPFIVVFIIYCCCICFLSYLEGSQVAILVAEEYDLKKYEQSHPRAYALMVRAKTEKNVRRYLIGRQFLVIFVVFLINQCTIFPEISQLGIDDAAWFIFIQLGLPTALNVLCFAQLPAQLLGNQDPMMYMNRYGPRATMEFCIYAEMTGIAHFSWVVSSFSKMTWFRISRECAASPIKDPVIYKSNSSVMSTDNTHV